MRTQLSMFDATSITIEEKRGDDKPNETIWTDITVRSGEGDVIEFTVFDCPPIQVGKEGDLCENVMIELGRSDPDSREQLRADYRTEVIRSQDRYRRAEQAEQACQQLRDSLVSAEKMLSGSKAANVTLADTCNTLRDELADQGAQLHTFRTANSDLADNVSEWNDRCHMLESQVADLNAELVTFRNEAAARGDA